MEAFKKPRQHTNVGYVFPQAKGRRPLQIKLCFQAHHIYSFYLHSDLHLFLFATSIVPQKMRRTKVLRKLAELREGSKAQTIKFKNVF